MSSQEFIDKLAKVLEDEEIDLRDVWGECYGINNALRDAGLGFISVKLITRTIEDRYGVIVIYYSGKIWKAIIIDSDFPTNFDSHRELAAALVKAHDEARKLEDALPNIRQPLTGPTDTNGQIPNLAATIARER